METKFLSLFSTPLWVTKVSESTLLNEQLFNARGKITSGIDYFDVDDVAIRQLKECVTNFVNNSLMTYYETNESFLHDIILTGRQNPIVPNSLDTPHHHPGALLVGVYYIRVPESSGDILFHDPRGSVRWEDTVLCSLKSHKTDATMAKEMGGVTASMFRPFHRLTPTPGTLILFPAYVIHQVETNLSNELRMSIAITINLKSRRH